MTKPIGVAAKLGAPFVRLLRKVGVDRAIAYTILGRGWAALTGPITLYLIANCLSGEEQGFYYTFANILGLQVFFELGLAYVILQFASHEKADLHWSAQGTLEGSEVAKQRLASLLRIAVIWYGVAGLLFVTVVLPVGLWFFSSHQPVGATVIWRLPWVWVVLVSAGTLFLSPIFGLLQGCGLVAEVAAVRVGQAIAGNLALWFVLRLHGHLYATPMLTTVGLVWSFGWVFGRFRPFLRDLAQHAHTTAGISWWQEVWPFQWKIAASWLSGYFIFQLFNPLLFAFRGAVEAGKMGMSISVMGAISAVAIAWVETKAAPFGTLVAKRDYRALDKMFFPCLWQSLSLVLLSGALFWAAAYYLHSIDHHYSHRILEPLPLGLLIITQCLNHIVFSEALYLRAHKQEPFLWISLIIAALVGISVYILGKSYGATGMMIGYLAVNSTLGLGVGTWIFQKKRREWHDLVVSG